MDFGSGERPALTGPTEMPRYEPNDPARRGSLPEKTDTSQTVLAPSMPQLESINDAAFVFSTMTDSPEDLSKAKEVTEVAPESVDYVDPTLFWDQLDELQYDPGGDHLPNDSIGDNSVKRTAGTVAITSPTMTAGYLFWMTDGGYLLVGLVSQLTASRLTQPRPMLVAAFDA